MNRRRQIEMTPEEHERFLQDSRTLILCTLDREGHPHAVAMWFCLIDGRVHMTSFRKAQKVLNLRRDPRATLLAESGDVYSELRGLMIRCRGEVIEDPDLCVDVLMKVQARHGGSEDPAVREALRSQAARRSVLCFEPVRMSSWDHGKLGGTY